MSGPTPGETAKEATTPLCTATAWLAPGRGGGSELAPKHASSRSPLARSTQLAGHAKGAPRLQLAPSNGTGCRLGALGRPQVAEGYNPSELVAWTWEASHHRIVHASSSDGRNLAPRSNRGTTSSGLREPPCARHMAVKQKKGETTGSKLSRLRVTAGSSCSSAASPAEKPPPQLALHPHAAPAARPAARLGQAAA